MIGFRRLRVRDLLDSEPAYLVPMSLMARRLGIDAILIVPYYWLPESVGLQYEAELRNLGCAAFSWRGFHHQTSGIDPVEFQEQLRRFYDTLGNVKLFPFLDISEKECLTWFADATTPVGPTACWILDDLLDIQPGGDANFCVDFPDYSIGNVRAASIEELWKAKLPSVSANIAASSLWPSVTVAGRSTCRRLARRPERSSAKHPITASRRPLLVLRIGAIPATA